MRRRYYIKNAECMHSVTLNTIVTTSTVIAMFLATPVVAVAQWELY